MRKSLSFPALLALLLAVLLIVLLLPVLRAAKYDLPSNDDLEFIETTADVWARTRSVPETVRAAAEHTAWKMDTWQGTYSAQFLMALQPGLFDLSYYAVTPCLLIGLLVLSMLVFYQSALSHFLKADRMTAAALALYALICCIELLPSAAQGFFWFNGGIFYTFYFALSLLLFSLLFAVYRTERAAALFPLALLSCLLAAFIAGGSYTSMLPTVLLLILFTLVAWQKRRRGAACVLTLTLFVFLIGMYINISAPGNAKRVAFELAYYGTVQMPAWKAIPLSIVYGVSALLYRFDGAMLLNILLTCTLLGPYLFKSGFRFRYPLIVLLFTVGVFSSAFTPTLYAGSTAGPLRSLNVVYFSEQILVSFNTAYCTGYFLKKYNLSPRLLLLAARAPVRAILLASVLLFAGVLRVGVLDTTSVRAARELSRGVLRDHYECQYAYLTTGVSPSDRVYSALLGAN